MTGATELAPKRAVTERALAALAKEKRNSSRWPLSAGLASQSAAFINAQIEERSGKEARLQEELWGVEDRLNELQKTTYRAAAIAAHLRDPVRVLPARCTSGSASCGRSRGSRGSK